jgi:hypothetical protein
MRCLTLHPFCLWLLNCQVANCTHHTKPHPNSTILVLKPSVGWFPMGIPHGWYGQFDKPAIYWGPMTMETPIDQWPFQEPKLEVPTI